MGHIERGSAKSDCLVGSAFLQVELIRLNSFGRLFHTSAPSYDDLSPLYRRMCLWNNCKINSSRCVQSKDRLITSLKEGVSSGGDDVAVSPAELDDMRQELDIVRDELQQSRMTIENLRVEAQVSNS